MTRWMNLQNITRFESMLFHLSLEGSHYFLHLRVKRSAGFDGRRYPLPGQVEAVEKVANPFIRKLTLRDCRVARRTLRGSDCKPFFFRILRSATNDTVAVRNVGKNSEKVTYNNSRRMCEAICYYTRVTLDLPFSASFAESTFARIRESLKERGIALRFTVS